LIITSDISNELKEHSPCIDQRLESLETGPRNNAIVFKCSLYGTGI